MVHVIPKPDMRVRPGQHVSVEGRLYHPYMAQWGSHWEVSKAMDCSASEVFA